MSPRTATGASMLLVSESVRKKHPMGTPALPMAEKTDMTSQSRSMRGENVMPPFCMTKSDVTSMNAAQPFMFIVVQIGRTKRETRLSTPIRSSAVCMVTGSVAAELLVSSAMTTAGIIWRRALRGFMPLTMRNRGRTTNIWRRLPPRMTAA